MIEFDKYKGVEGLTREQQDEICYLIGEWYLDWKHALINWDTTTHRLGFAKEKLKEMICGSVDSNDESSTSCHQLECEHESDGIDHVFGNEGGCFQMNQCKKCGEFYR